MIEKEHILHIIKHSYICLFSLIVLILTSCDNTDPNTRPSPLTVDSIIINNKIYKTEYSSPSVRKRKIWGELEPYDQVWRTGANDASLINIQSDIKLGDDILPKGKYSFFTIPSKGKWTLIFNKQWKQWGAYSYDQSEDQLRITFSPSWMDENQEKLKIYFTNDEFILRWEFVKLAIPFTPI
ncbi:MAG: hypothetical protein ACI9A7_001939 [Cyclobacteriaceae bacterium]